MMTNGGDGGRTLWKQSQNIPRAAAGPRLHQRRRPVVIQVVRTDITRSTINDFMDIVHQLTGASSSTSSTPPPPPFAGNQPLTMSGGAAILNESATKRPRTSLGSGYHNPLPPINPPHYSPTYFFPPPSNPMLSTSPIYYFPPPSTQSTPPLNLFPFQAHKISISDQSSHVDFNLLSQPPLQSSFVNFFPVKSSPNEFTPLTPPTVQSSLVDFSPVNFPTTYYNPLPSTSPYFRPPPNPLLPTSPRYLRPPSNPLPMICEIETKEEDMSE